MKERRRGRGNEDDPSPAAQAFRRARRGGSLAWPAAALVLLAWSAARTEAWGFAGHRLVNRRAIATLPGDIRPLFEANADYLSEHSIDADLRRLTPDDPDHFLDMDAFGDPSFDAIPRGEAEHLARFGLAARAKGRLPWRMGEVHRELIAAFRKRDPALILERAAELGHFVADAHVPLHATQNHDGQLSGQAGIHARWEGELVERFERQLAAELAPAPAQRVADPVSLAFDVLLGSYADSHEVLASDRACAGPRDFADTPEDDRYDAAYYSRLYEREGARVRTRLAQATTALGSLWRSAWEEAGRPPLDASFRFPYVRGRLRAVLISLDGAAATVVADAVARGLMPRLARLRAGGAVARGSIPALPCRTAPSHAALYTGAWPDRNGIGGNDVSIPGRSILERGCGFSSTYLRAEPIWVTAARQGLEATVVSATQVFPFEPFLSGKRFDRDYGRRLTLLDGYGSLAAADAAYDAAALAAGPAVDWLGLPRHNGEPREFAIEVGGTRIHGLLYDDPEDQEKGLDTLYLGLAKDASGGATLKPQPPNAVGDPAAFGQLRIRLGGAETAVHFRLFALAPDGAEILLYRTAPHVLRSTRPRLESAALAATGGFVGNGAHRLYEDGALGRPLWAGGDGTAERRYLETAGLAVRQLSRLTQFALERTSWDVLLSYLPFPDEALHLWLGRLDPSLSGHDPTLAARLRPFMDRVLALCDDFVGRVSAATDDRTLLAVAADHGHQATDRIVRPNAALAAAGLLALNAAGQVELSRTQALYVPGGFVVINRAALPGGTVRPAEEEAVRRAAAAALTAIRDPRSGAAAVLEVIDPRQRGRTPVAGAVTGGDLYLSLARHYRVSSELRGAIVEQGAPAGDHLSNPERPEMHASFALAGPGVAAGADLGIIRQIDVAQTLCELLGIGPPAHATGQVLTGALAATMTAPSPR